MSIPKRASDRLVAGIKKFQPIINACKARDINESDTSTIVQDILNEVFGYEKYSEITSEYAIRNTYCDLAIKVDGNLKLLIELKAIGIDLKENHLKQATDYAANQGVDWVVLSNGQHWHIYKIAFTKPINFELVQSFDFLALNHKKEEDIAKLFLLSKEAWSKAALDSFHDKLQLINKHTIGAILISEETIAVIKRSLKKLSPDIKINEDVILNILREETIKRDVFEGEKADKARKQIARLASAKKEKSNEQKSIENQDQKEVV